MKMLYGKPLADKMLAETKTLVSKLDHTPVLQVMCNDYEQPYFKGIRNDARYCGIDVITWGYDSEDKVDGVISLDPSYDAKVHMDVDGGSMVPCTAEAIMLLLRWYKVSLAGKNVCIIGRSPRVGRPLVNLLIDADATVTVCHSKTKNLMWQLMSKDIVISCVGNAGFDMRGISNHYMTLVDVGNDLNNIEDCAALVPFVGGVGPVTRAVLMRHVYEKAKMKEDER